MIAEHKGVARFGGIFVALALVMNGATYALLRNAPFDNHLKALATALIVCPTALYLTIWILRRSTQKALAEKLPIATAAECAIVPSPPPVE